MINVILTNLGIDRSDNGVKNHWNCMVKRKPDLNKPSSSSIELKGGPSLTVCNSQVKLGAKGCSKMSPKNVPWKTDGASCSTELALGNANMLDASEKSRINRRHLGPWKPLSSSWNLLSNSLYTFKSNYDLDVIHPDTRKFTYPFRPRSSSCGLNGGHLGSWKPLSEGSFDKTRSWDLLSNTLNTTKSYDDLDPYRRRSILCGLNGVHFGSRKPPSLGSFDKTRSWNLLSNSVNTFKSNEDLDIVHLGTRKFTYPYRPRSTLCGLNGVHLGSSKPLSTGSFNKTRSWKMLSNSLNNIKSYDDLDIIHRDHSTVDTSLSLSLCGSSDWSKRAGKRNLSLCGSSDGSTRDGKRSLSLCGPSDECTRAGKRDFPVCESSDESTRSEKRSRVSNTPLLVDQKESSSLCNKPTPLIYYRYIEHSSSQFVDSYPSNNGSPESMKSSALSYRNRPSIFRKTAFKEVSNATFSNSEEGASSSNAINSNSEEGASSSNLNSEKSGSSVIGPALGRCLDYEFGLEWYSKSIKRCTPASATPSSELKVATKMVPTP